MRNAKNLRRLLILSLLLAPTIFLSNCTSTQAANADAGTALAALVPPTPAPPETEPVQFEDRDGGLWLSYNDYRALERNIIALREYARRLEITIWFYRDE
jgi:hypothetical protein